MKLLFLWLNRDTMQLIPNYVFLKVQFALKNRWKRCLHVYAFGFHPEFQMVDQSLLPIMHWMCLAAL